MNSSEGAIEKIKINLVLAESTQTRLSLQPL